MRNTCRRCSEKLARMGKVLPCFHSVCSLQIGEEKVQEGVSGPGEGQSVEDHSQWMEVILEVSPASSSLWPAEGEREANPPGRVVRGPLTNFVAH